MIERGRYIERLEKRKHNGRVKVITGVRRCGKSYLLFEMFASHLRAQGVDDGHIVKIALDEEEFAELRNPIALGKHIRSRIKGNGWHYVFIDEIQLCRKVANPGFADVEIDKSDSGDAVITFYDVLNGLLHIPNLDVYVTGSNSRMLSKDIATDFRGRGDVIELHPLSFAEFLPATGLNEFNALRQYMIYGGMPLAVLEETATEKEAYLKGLFSEIYFKDISERNRVKDPAVLESVCDSAFSSIGSLTNPHRLTGTLNAAGIVTNDHTLAKYLEYLEDAFLISKARRFDVKGKHYLDFPSKYYAEDPGLRNARLNFRQVEFTHLMENIIYNELVRRGFSVDVGVIFMQGKDAGKRVLRQHEIDFVVNMGSIKLYIQSAFAVSDDAKKEQETFSLKRTGDSFRKIVVTGGMEPTYTDDNGILFTNVIDFLLDEKLIQV